MNIGRIAVMRAGWPNTVSGMTVNRFCSSGLQSIALAAQQIMAGMGEVIIAGGSESMSMISMTGHAYSPNPTLMEIHPRSTWAWARPPKTWPPSTPSPAPMPMPSRSPRTRKPPPPKMRGSLMRQIVPIDVVLDDVDKNGQANGAPFSSSAMSASGATARLARWRT